MNNKILILTTAIKVPENIKHICDAITYYLNNIHDNITCGDIVDFLIVGDLIEKDKEKEIIYKCRQYDNNFMYGHIKYLGYDEQRSLFNKYPLLENIIFTRSIQRRNIGILEAIIKKYDYMISIDDDNYPIDDKWLYDFMNHKDNKYSLIYSHNGWVDIPHIITNISSRGFPILTKGDIHYIYGHCKDNIYGHCKDNIYDKSDKIVCHQGFISGEPDRNALHRYCYSDINVESKIFTTDYIIDKNNWCVFNTQNTLFKKEIFPLLFLFPMKKILSNGYMIDRYDDIFMSYIVNKILHKYGWYISFGHPIMFQKRNIHNIEREVFTEMTGAIIAESFIKFLQNINLEGNTPLACYKEIAYKLFEYSSVINDSIFNYLKDMSKDMIIWHNIVSEIEFGTN